MSQNAWIEPVLTVTGTKKGMFAVKDTLKSKFQASWAKSFEFWVIDPKHSTELEKVLSDHPGVMMSTEYILKPSKKFDTDLKNKMAEYRLSGGDDRLENVWCRNLNGFVFTKENLKRMKTDFGMLDENGEEEVDLDVEDDVDIDSISDDIIDKSEGDEDDVIIIDDDGDSPTNRSLDSPVDQTRKNKTRKLLGLAKLNTSLNGFLKTPEAIKSNDHITVNNFCKYVDETYIMGRDIHPLERQMCKALLYYKHSMVFEVELS
mgnify:CR=1 FL=1|uniref:Uncharacterized protein n=1 Tax=viral metagenome TaxID=1070528 RepID=A0A6C0CKD0_9ZZZZ